MPSATPGGWPYPLPGEPVRDGSAAIANLAAKSQDRLNKYCVFGAYFVGNFNSSGLYYPNGWASMGVTFTTTPIVSAIPLLGATGNGLGVALSIYNPQNSPTAAVFMCHKCTDGNVFTGTLEFYAIAIGEGKWN
jgi:hypothetical protein